MAAAVMDGVAAEPGTALSAAGLLQSSLTWSQSPETAATGAAAGRIFRATPAARAPAKFAASALVVSQRGVPPHSRPSSCGGEKRPVFSSAASAAGRAHADGGVILAAAVDANVLRGDEGTADFFKKTLLRWQPAAHCHVTPSSPLQTPAAGAAAAAAQLLQQHRFATAGWVRQGCSSATAEHAGASLAVPAGAGGGGSPPPAAAGAAVSAGGPPAGTSAPGGAGGNGGSRGSRKRDEIQQHRSMKEILDYAAGQAFKGGIAGASAQVLNVFAFMWLRTTMNYQYRYGKSTIGAIKQLYAEGGVVRFYRGLLPALMQSPLSRFGDTAANVGVLAALDSRPVTRDLPVGVKTAVASCGAAAWRFFLMPIDAWKTTKQVEGGSGLKILARKVRHHGFSKLYHGSVAAMGATWVGHYPWFFVHNYLSEKLPQFDGVPQGRHVRYGLIGFVSSVVSDTCSNSIRVLKTTKQTSVEPMTYSLALREVLSKDGVTGLLFRGLGTRILTNGLQGMVFSVGWKAIQSQLSK